MKEKQAILKYVIQDNVKILKTIFENKKKVSRETLETLLEQFNENNDYLESKEV